MLELPRRAEGLPTVPTEGSKTPHELPHSRNSVMGMLTDCSYNTIPGSKEVDFAVAKYVLVLLMVRSKYYEDAVTFVKIGKLIPVTVMSVND